MSRLLRIQRSPDYISFRSSCARQEIELGGCRKWVFYEQGCKTKGLIPLICVPGTTTRSEVFFHIICALGCSGFHVLAVDYPPASTFREWCVNFVEFLDFFNFKKCHLFGLTLGGYLCLWLAKLFPTRVASLILCNSFSNTDFFHSASFCRSMFTVAPTFILRRYLLDSFPAKVDDERIRNAVDFVLQHCVEELNRDELLSRLHLHTTKNSLGDVSFTIPITAIFTLDSGGIPTKLQTELLERIPAKPAFLKTGGDFPLLSRPEEVLLHLRLHLNQLPDTVQCFDGDDQNACSNPPSKIEESRKIILFSRGSSAPHPEIQEEEEKKRRKSTSIVTQPSPPVL